MGELAAMEAAVGTGGGARSGGASECCCCCCCCCGVVGTAAAARGGDPGAKKLRKAGAEASLACCGTDWCCPEACSCAASAWDWPTICATLLSERGDEEEEDVVVRARAAARAAMIIAAVFLNAPLVTRRTVGGEGEGDTEDASLDAEEGDATTVVAGGAETEGGRGDAEEAGVSLLIIGEEAPVPSTTRLEGEEEAGATPLLAESVETTETEEAEAGVVSFGIAPLLVAAAALLLSEGAESLASEIDGSDGLAGGCGTGEVFLCCVSRDGGAL